MPRTAFFRPCLNRLVLFHLSLLILIFASPVNVFSQTEEEMKLLRMYFKEDELVIAPTRAPKLLSQVAENISIVTAEEIRAMNAHTVVEVLSRIPGVYISFFGEDFGSDANLSIQGSEPEHILVLLDNVPWNSLTGGNAVTQTIPVEIIERIEVIKGPASSSWGSSLGGVINIVTKEPAKTKAPSGSLRASYGERSTQDYRTELTGTYGNIGYYFYAGRQESRGLRDDRDYNNDSVYAKIDVPLSSNLGLKLTAGYSEPHIDYGDFPSQSFPAGGISGRINITRVYFATAALSAVLAENLSLEGSFYTRYGKFIQETDELNTGSQYFDQISEDDSFGGSGKILWRDKTHNAVIGFDASDGRLYQELDSGPSLQAYGSPATSRSDSGITKWAIFINDTITLGDLSVTPGIRYDRNNVNGDFTSPSIGATYRVAEKTILRAAFARGFTTPPLNFTSGGGLFLDPNPDLDPENVLSYQGGVESWIGDMLHVKSQFFHHNTKDALIKELYAAGPPTFNDLYFNKGEIKRTGVELVAGTAPFYNLSLETGFSFVRIRLINEEIYKNDGIDTSQKRYTYQVNVKYDDIKYVTALLSGRYVWWDSDDNDNKYDTFIWDLNLDKNVYSSGDISGNIFFTVHNIFNGSSYTVGDRKNPRRWIETGVRLSF